MFLRSAARPVAVECFFCLSPSLLPPRQFHASAEQRDREKRRAAAIVSLSPVGTRWNWKCERCGCWNIRDQNGEMVSDLPAMHKSALNEHSFSLRATPSKSHLHLASSSSRSSLFCHSCEANQVLIMNMLANYLPADDDPTFQSLYDNLPHYLASLHTRYPPVCSSCQPAVDAALQKSDQKAQSEAWGLALRRGALVKSLERVTVGPSVLAILVWRIRGVLFCLGTAFSVAVDALAWANNETFQRLRPFALWLAALHAGSSMWIAWDPYWLRKTRGKAKVTGRRVWVRNMVIAMAVRIVASLSLSFSGGEQVARGAMGLEMGLLLHALVSLRISQPVPLKLVRPVSLSTTPQPDSSPSRNASTDPVGLSSLSLEHGPIRSQVSNPIFGQPSLVHLAKEEEPMDWEPAPSAPAPARSSGSSDEDEDYGWRSRRSDWDTFGVGKQRMFPGPRRQDETGLETLLAGWGLGNNAGAGVVEPRGQAVPVSSSGGLIVDSQLVRSVTLVLAAARLAGAFGGIASHIAQDHIAIIGTGLGLGIAPMLLRADTALSSLEAGTAAIDLVISLKKQDGKRIALLSGVLAVRAIVGALVVFGSVLGLSLGALWTEWIGAVGWVGWALVDVVCA